MQTKLNSLTVALESSRSRSIKAAYAANRDPNDSRLADEAKEATTKFLANLQAYRVYTEST